MSMTAQTQIIWNGLLRKSTLLKLSYHSLVEQKLHFCHAPACVSRWPRDLADADLPTNSASSAGGLRPSDVPAAFRNQHGHVSVKEPD